MASPSKLNSFLHLKHVPGICRNIKSQEKKKLAMWNICMNFSMPGNRYGKFWATQSRSYRLKTTWTPRQYTDNSASLGPVPRNSSLPWLHLLAKILIKAAFALYI